MWKKFYDGWFEYYYNIKTGERKFKLEPGDKLVDYITLRTTKGATYELQTIPYRLPCSR